MTAPASPPRLLLFAAGVALSLSAYSAATGDPERPARTSDLREVVTELREVVTKLRGQATRLEARVGELEKRHPRLSNAEVLQGLRAVAAKHGVKVTALEVRPNAPALRVRIEMDGSSLRSLAKFRNELKSELLGTGRCSDILCHKVTVTSEPELMTSDVKLLRPPLE